MSRRTAIDRVTKFFVAKKARRAVPPPAGSDVAGGGLVFPISGVSKQQWSAAIEVSFEAGRLPRSASAMRVKLLIESGHAGVGWYDVDGPAEEVIVGPAPNSQTIYLSVWEPDRCRQLIIRSARRTALRVTLETVEWEPLSDVLASEGWRSSLARIGEGMFADLPFRGTLAESLWRGRHEARHDDPDVRLGRLRNLAALAWQHCPGYRNWWSRHGWHPSDLKALESAAQIPVVTKAQIRADLDAFTLPRRDALSMTTAGTTGEPFSFRYTASLRAAHLSHVAAAASLALPELPPWQMSLLTVRGSPARGPSRTGAGGELNLSPSGVRQRDLLTSLIRAYRPSVIRAYPSTAVSLADALGDTYRFRGAVLGSENALPAQIQAIEQIAEKVLVTYGLSEGAAFALRCPSCGSYGETTSHALITLRPRADRLFDIIGTAFWALGTLFIGYQTGDLTTGAVDACSECLSGGLHLAHVQGRGQDMVVDRYGIRHSLVLLTSSAGFRPSMAQIRLFDCLQGPPGHLVMRYVTRNGQPLDHDLMSRVVRTILPDLTLFEPRFSPELSALREQLPVGSKWKLVKPLE
jgi:hypothetical protein